MYRKEEKMNARIIGAVIVMSIFLVSNFGCTTTPQETVPAPKTFTNSFGMNFVKIPSGSFMMGSGISASQTASQYGGKEGYYKDEHPQHRVTITKNFYMQTTEVTVGQWKSFIQDIDYKTEAETRGGAWIYSGSAELEFKVGYYWDNPGFEQSDKNPVTCVSWNDVQAFVRWLNRKEGKTYRLPTEAEWEYACRAGSTTTFYFGNDKDRLGKYAWYQNNSGKHTHPVGEKEPNSWGLHDMYGNVSEWCQDWYGKYPSGSVTDPTGPPSGSERIVRGGAWITIPRFGNSTFRYMFAPNSRFGGPGLRLVRNL